MATQTPWEEPSSSHQLRCPLLFPLLGELGRWCGSVGTIQPDGSLVPIRFGAWLGGPDLVRGPVELEGQGTWSTEIQRWVCPLGLGTPMGRASEHGLGLVPRVHRTARLHHFLAEQRAQPAWAGTDL